MKTFKLFIALITIYLGLSCKKDIQVSTPPAVNSTSTTIQFFRGIGVPTAATNRTYSITKYNNATGASTFAAVTNENFPIVTDTISACLATNGTSITFPNGNTYDFNFKFVLNGDTTYSEYELTISSTGVITYDIIKSEMIPVCTNKLIFKY